RELRLAVLGERRVPDAAVVEDDGVGVEWRAVVELHVLAELERRGEPVIRPAHRQGGHDRLRLVVVADERLLHEERAVARRREDEGLRAVTPANWVLREAVDERLVRHRRGRTR